MSDVNQYANGRKRTWRGWQWNQIVSKLALIDGLKKTPSRGSAAERGVTSNRVCMYLAGPEPFDLECAVSRQFRRENCFAVDRDIEAIHSVRRSGGIGLQGDLGDVIKQWRGDIHIDVIVADFCCGFTKTADKFLLALQQSPAVSPNTVIALNLQRGNIGGDIRMDNFLSGLEGAAELKANRAWRWLMFSSYFLSLRSHTTAERFRHGDSSARWSRMIDHCSAAFMSYKNTGPTMDSCVFRWFGDCSWLKFIEDDFDGVSPYSGLTGTNRTSPALRCQRKIAAARAVRTMKLQRN